MNKKVFNTIFLFTAFVILGIIAMQLVWLNNLSIIRKKELSTNTQQALTNTVSKLEQDEHKKALMDHGQGFTRNSIVANDSDSWSEIKVVSNIQHKSDKDLNIEIESLNQTERVVNRIVYNFNSLSDTDGIKVREVGMIKMEKLRKNLDSLAGQILIEMESNSLHKRLHTGSLKQILREQLYQKGIDIDFEFAVWNGDSIVAKSQNYIPSSIAMTFETKLFPNDIFDKNFKLILYYPVSSSSGYIFSKMKTFLLLTGVFTIAILIAFYLTIKTIRRQKKLSDIKNDFINNITHEFKTPIATSSIAIAALENKQVRTDNEKFDYYTSILKEENLKMNLQVEKVLQMAVMEKGKVEVFIEEVNVHEMIHKSVKSFELLFKENGIVIILSLNAEKYIVKSDAFHLVHVFNNIIDNSIKYRNENCELVIYTESKTNQLLIHFKDNGPGMNAEVQKNAFEKFYRGQKGDLHDVKGFGLGLSYAKNIVEHCKGSIYLNSTPGNGTEVVVSLPLV